MMTYEETIEKIHKLNKFGSKLGLERMGKLMELLGNPQDEMQVIHVAGTNGKGSVCRYVYTVLKEAGYTVGLYTSPFLERFTERIECNGMEISQEDLIKNATQVFEKVDEMLAMGLDSPTEFELVTAIGFCYFKDKDIDFLVLEVGLGGRGDSTNIVRNPIITAITSISYDHMEYLGDTLEKIAIEKAGIIKNGVPVISNVKDEGAAREIEKIALAKGCPYYGVRLGEIHNLMQSISGYGFDLKMNERLFPSVQYDNLLIPMIGMHQVENAICAISVIEVLKEKGIINVSTNEMYVGMRKAVQTGRMEVISHNPMVIIDGAHNEAGAKALENVMKFHFPKQNIFMIVGMLADKKMDKLLESFCAIASQLIATEPDNPRKLDATILCDAIEKNGKPCIAFPDPEEAFLYAMERINPNDIVVVAGSLYLIGRIRGMVKNEKK